MRLKINSPGGLKQYERVLGLLRDRHVGILVKNDRRYMVAVAEVSADVRRELNELGASVAEDIQYASE